MSNDTKSRELEEPVNLRPPPQTAFVPANRSSLNSVLIGIVAILPHEFAATCQILGCNQTVVGSGGSGTQTYRLGVVWQPSKNRGIHVAVVQAISAGLTDAAVLATDLLHHCPNLREIIVCGIAGAIPNPTNSDDHVRIGDIVVSGLDGVQQYDFGKQYPKRFEVRGSPFRPSATLLRSARTLQSDEEKGARPWDNYIDIGVATLGEGYARPPAETDLLCEPNFQTPLGSLTRILVWLKQAFGNGRAKYKAIPHPCDPNRESNPGRPRVFHGLILSANKVLADQIVREDLREEFRTARAVEMEAAGIAHATHQAQIGYFVVRGTSDYCNGDKNNRWQRYAALIAAAYTRALIEATNPAVFAGQPKVLAIAVPATAPELAPQTEDVSVDAEHHARRDIGALHIEPDAVVGADGKLVLSKPVFTVASAVDAPPVGKVHAESVLPTIQFAGYNVLSLPATPVILTGSNVLATGSDDLQRAPNEGRPSETVTGVDDDAGKHLLEDQLLISEGERRIAEITKLVDVWEYESAYALAGPLSDWVQIHEQRLPPKLRFELYSQLARIEAIHLRGQKDRGEPYDPTKARFFLAKAKHVSE